MRTLLNCIDYDKFKWKLCGYLKVLGLLLGTQGGYTSYCCFLCEWDIRDNKHHYVRKDWPQLHTFTPGKINISCETFVNPRDA